MVYSILKSKILSYAIIRIRYGVMASFLVFTGSEGFFDTRFYTETLKAAIFYDRAILMGVMI